MYVVCLIAYLILFALTWFAYLLSARDNYTLQYRRSLFLSPLSLPSLRPASTLTADDSTLTGHGSFFGFNVISLAKMDVNWSEPFDEILSNDEETPTTTTATSIPSPSPQVSKARPQQRQFKQQRQAPNSTKKNNKWATSSTRSLSTPSMKLAQHSSPISQYRSTRRPRTRRRRHHHPQILPSFHLLHRRSFR